MPVWAASEEIYGQLWQAKTPHESQEATKAKKPRKPKDTEASPRLETDKKQATNTPPG